MFGFGYKVYNSKRGTSGVSLNPVVQSFVDDNGISNTTEINALNRMYVNLTTLVNSHGGSVLYLNGVSPTSYAASKKAIIYGTGNQTAIEISGTPTHSTDGIFFDSTSKAWNVGTIIPNLYQDEIMLITQRYSNTSVNGVASGYNYALADQIQLSLNGLSGSSGFNQPNNYTGFAFNLAGQYISYNNGTTYGIWKSGIFQTPTSTYAPVHTLEGTRDFYISGRNQSGSLLNGIGERLSTYCAIHDGGTLFNSTQIQEISDIINAYNLAV